MLGDEDDSCMGFALFLCFAVIGLGIGCYSLAKDEPKVEKAVQCTCICDPENKNTVKEK